MAPTLYEGDCVLVRGDATAKRPFARGDVVVFAVLQQAEEHMLKRIVGLPGEEITFDDGMLFIDGKRLMEGYLHGLPAYVGMDKWSVALGRDEYFVMGDNRARSTDSRNYGAIGRRQIEGKVVFRILPLPRWGRV